MSPSSLFLFSENSISLACGEGPTGKYRVTHERRGCQRKTVEIGVVVRESPGTRAWVLKAGKAPHFQVCPFYQAKKRPGPFRKEAP
jgi:hypothetical protein